VSRGASSLRSIANLVADPCPQARAEDGAQGPAEGPDHGAQHGSDAAASGLRSMTVPIGRPLQGFGDAPLGTTSDHDLLLASLLHLHVSGQVHSRRAGLPCSAHAGNGAPLNP